jgi:hypothetical protein
MKSLKLGSLNASHLATIFDKKGNAIGNCLDTPNNAAVALLINNEAFTVKTPFNGIWDREFLQNRFYGLDVKYHNQFINYFNEA